MTIQMESEPRSRLPLRRRARPLFSVAVGRLLAKLPPARLERVLLFARRGARPPTVAEALQARRDVVSVSALCAGQYCLERSLSTVVLARLRGLWPDWATGITMAPFAAHAWIEVAGQPIGELLKLDGFHKTLFVPLEKQGPDPVAARASGAIKKKSAR